MCHCMANFATSPQWYLEETAKSESLEGAVLQLYNTMLNPYRDRVFLHHKSHKFFSPVCFQMLHAKYYLSQYFQSRRNLALGLCKLESLFFCGSDPDCPCFPLCACESADRLNRIGNCFTYAETFFPAKLLNQMSLTCLATGFYKVYKNLSSLRFLLILGK